MVAEQWAFAELAKRELCKRLYKEYCYAVHLGAFKKTRLALYLCDTVQEFIEQKTENAYDILILSVPPQHGKSMSITETLPSWYLGRNPTKRVIEISYNDDFAKLFGRKNKQKINGYGGKIFGITLAKTPKSDSEFDLSNNIGGMISRGALAGVTGRPADLMIIDDPVKNRQEADSPAYRKRLFDEWQNSYKTRLSAGAKVILIQTRWHEDDLAGKLIKTEKNVKVINIPCEALAGDVLGRNVGDSLCPELGKDNKWLSSFKEGYITSEGSRAWSALFQGSPTTVGGNIIKKDWFKFYNTLPKMGKTILAVDATFKGNDNNDFVALQVWGKHTSGYYLIDAVKRHMGFNDTIRAIKDLKEKHSGIFGTYIEDKANGSAIIEVLSRVFDDIIAVGAVDSKISRVNAITPIIESGKVFVPYYSDFSERIIKECCEFPNATNDDEVDALQIGLNNLKNITLADEYSEGEASEVEEFLNF